MKWRDLATKRKSERKMAGEQQQQKKREKNTNKINKEVEETKTQLIRTVACSRMMSTNFAMV